jgi:hypothetical protein
LQTVTDIRQFPRREVDALLLDVRALSLALSALSAANWRATVAMSSLAVTSVDSTPGRQTCSRTQRRVPVARVEIGGRRDGQEVRARWIDGRVQGDREFLKLAGLDPGTRFEDPHAFVEFVEKLLDKGSASVVLDLPQRDLPKRQA